MKRFGQRTLSSLSFSLFSSYSYIFSVCVPSSRKSAVRWSDNTLRVAMTRFGGDGEGVNAGSENGTSICGCELDAWQWHLLVSRVSRKFWERRTCIGRAILGKRRLGLTAPGGCYDTEACGEGMARSSVRGELSMLHKRKKYFPPQAVISGPVGF